MRVYFFAVISALLFTINGFASSSPFSKKQPTPSTSGAVIATYEGVVGKTSPLVFAMQAEKNGHVEGQIATLAPEQVLKVSGTLKQGVLDIAAYDDAQNVTSHIQGQIVQIGAKQIIMGNWIDSYSGIHHLITLNLRSLDKGSFNHWYAPAGVKKDTVIDMATAAFRKAVALNDEDRVAQQIRYPISVFITPKHKITVRNANELKAHYAQIFNPVYRDSILKTVPHMLRATQHGIALGDGWLWFDAHGKVTSLYVLF